MSRGYIGQYPDGTPYPFPATDTEPGLIELATQAEQEAGSDATRAVTPGRQHFHPSAAKAWVNFNGTGTVAIREDYGVSSITDNNTGDYTVNLDTSFSAATYAVVTAAGVIGAGTAGTTTRLNSSPANLAVGSFQIVVGNHSSVADNAFDADHVAAAAYGDH